MSAEEIDWKKQFEVSQKQNSELNEKINEQRKAIEFLKGNKIQIEHQRDSYYALIEMMVEKLVQR